jgi:hypothetical protein
VPIGVEVIVSNICVHYFTVVCGLSKYTILALFVSLFIGKLIVTGLHYWWMCLDGPKKAILAISVIVRIS